LARQMALVPSLAARLMEDDKVRVNGEHALK
jgi:hypothetical protein